MSSLPFYNISEFCSLDCSNRRTCTDKWKVYLILFFLIHIKGTFSDMTQVKQAKTTNHFLFRNFALIKKKKRQPKISHPLEQGTDESLRTTASMTPLYLVGKWWTGAGEQRLPLGFGLLAPGNLFTIPVDRPALKVRTHLFSCLSLLWAQSSQICLRLVHSLTSSLLAPVFHGTHCPWDEADLNPPWGPCLCYYSLL